MGYISKVKIPSETEAYDIFADKSLKDGDGNVISTTYLKTADAPKIGTADTNNKLKKIEYTEESAIPSSPDTGTEYACTDPIGYNDLDSDLQDTLSTKANLVPTPDSGTVLYGVSSTSTDGQPQAITAGDGIVIDAKADGTGAEVKVDPDKGYLSADLIAKGTMARLDENGNWRTIAYSSTAEPAQLVYRNGSGNFAANVITEWGTPMSANNIPRIIELGHMIKIDSLSAATNGTLTAAQLAALKTHVGYYGEYTNHYILFNNERYYPMSYGHEAGYQTYSNVDSDTIKRIKVNMTTGEWTLTTNNVGGATNIQNGTGTGAVKQTTDPKYSSLAIATKNPNAAALDSTLTDSEPLGAVGDYSSAFGGNTSAQGKRSCASGTSTLAKGAYSHAEGDSSVSLGDDSHAEGYQTTAKGNMSHTEGGYTIASGKYSHAEGFTTAASGEASHTEGGNTSATQPNAHAEGIRTQAIAAAAHAEGGNSIASGEASHAEGGRTTASGPYAHAEGDNTKANGDGSHAEGGYTEATGNLAHAEGYSAKATGDTSHAEGTSTTAGGTYSHAEGAYTSATGDVSHAEGSSTKTFGAYAHSEGASTVAQGEASHAQGNGAVANGKASDAGGYRCSANGDYSFARGNNSIARNEGQSALGVGIDSGSSAIGGMFVGKYNAPNDSAIFQVGNGTSTTARSNAFSIDSSGNATIAGRLSVASAPVNDNDVVRKADLASAGGGSWHTEKPADTSKVQFTRMKILTTDSIPSAMVGGECMAAGYNPSITGVWCVTYSDGVIRVIVGNASLTGAGTFGFTGTYLPEMSGSFLDTPNGGTCSVQYYY